MSSTGAQTELNVVCSGRWNSPRLIKVMLEIRLVSVATDSRSGANAATGAARVEETSAAAAGSWSFISRDEASTFCPGAYTPVRALVAARRHEPQRVVAKRTFCIRPQGAAVGVGS